MSGDEARVGIGMRHTGLGNPPVQERVETSPAHLAFAWLEKAYQERDPELTYIKVPHRRFEPLRRDPRFGKLLVRMGLAH